MTRRWRWLRRTPSGSCASSWPPRRTSRRRSCSPRTGSSTRSIQPGKLTRSSFWNSPKWVWNDLDSREIFNIKYPWRRVHSWRKLYSVCLTRTAAATSTSPSLCRWGWPGPAQVYHVIMALRWSEGQQRQEPGHARGQAGLDVRCLRRWRGRHRGCWGDHQHRGGALQVSCPLSVVQGLM